MDTGEFISFYDHSDIGLVKNKQYVCIRGMILCF